MTAPERRGRLLVLHHCVVLAVKRNLTMNNKLVRDLASVTEELTAPAVVELTETEISAVAGGYMLADVMADDK